MSILPDWYADRVAALDLPEGEAPPAPYSLAPWSGKGAWWRRSAFWPHGGAPATVVVANDKTGECRVFVSDREGRALPTVTARNPADGRRIADVLLAGLGWPTG